MKKIIYKIFYFTDKQFDLIKDRILFQIIFK
jgi:hypothetical protein